MTAKQQKEEEGGNRLTDNTTEVSGFGRYEELEREMQRKERERDAEGKRRMQRKRKAFIS